MIKKRSSTYFQQYYEENKERLLQNSIQYRIEHREEYNIYKRQWCNDNREKTRAYSRKWRTNNPEKCNLYQKQNRSGRDVERICSPMPLPTEVNCIVDLSVDLN